MSFRDTIAKLPDLCYSVYPTNKRQVTLLRLGVRGYWSVCELPDNDSARQYVNEQNAVLGVTRRQESAMQHGSVFGFDAPAADPDNDVNDVKDDA
jgi:hypothetical protein